MMRLHRLLLGLFLLVPALVLGPGVAAQPLDDPIAELPADQRPRWSGIDARAYSGPVPESPGSVISVKALDPVLVPAGASTAYRVLYATTDLRGNPAVSTAAIYLPAGEPPPGGWRSLAHAHGTFGLGDHCAPSARLLPDALSAAYTMLLDEGYAVIVSDYQGLGTPGEHAYLHGPTAARNVLDSVRAARGLDLPITEEWAVLGHSQGGQVALHVEHEARAMAPGLLPEFRGAVAIAPGVNVASLAPLVTPELPGVLPAGVSTFGVLIVAAMDTAYPDLSVSEALTPLGAEALEVARTRCTKPVSNLLEGSMARDLLVRPLTDVPGATAAADEYLRTPVRGYEHPVLIVQGLADTAVPAPLVLAFAAELASNGEFAELHIEPEADHLTVLESSRAVVLEFLDSAWS
ncbi:alpha/beta hydrolase family protein [Lolliginicoccus levis]|uniref:alpha/beta hydrolase family protein n=1 Tax=Lolliginicoccus levis TaxID=2919542 RepID=UPI00241D2764|nr:alpha/beta fold hydrolase [Lolliginicoccus levis]